jgi:hypothetical protein
MRFSAILMTEWKCNHHHPVLTKHEAVGYGPDYGIQYVSCSQDVESAIQLNIRAVDPTAVAFAALLLH